MGKEAIRVSYRFLEEKRILRACRLLGVCRSGYYAWKARPLSRRAKEDFALTQKILEIHRQSKGLYGAPRIWAELRLKHGVRCSRKRVARLMRVAGIAGARRRRARGTTRSEGKRAPHPDLVSRNFAVEAPHRLWVADLTPNPTEEGWLYLAWLPEPGGVRKKTFSILSRIVGAATPNLICTVVRKWPFSILSRIVGAATATLSVANAITLAFSILSRIVGAATMPLPLPYRRYHWLSVSSVGSWALQPLRKHRMPSTIPPFSILSRIVGAATTVYAIRSATANRLSVSSVGSWALQPEADGALIGEGSLTFSILSRIVGAATLRITPRGRKRFPFQYPQSDRGRCNEKLRFLVQLVLL